MQAYASVTNRCQLKRHDNLTLGDESTNTGNLPRL